MAAQGVSAASLLSSGEASGAPSALRAVLAGGDEAIQAFSQAFGPRRLLRLLSKSSPSPELEQLADAVLSACAKGAGEGELGVNNFSTSQDLGVLHKDSMYPDMRIALTRPLYDHPLPEAAEWRSAVRLWLPLGNAEHVNASHSESQAFFFFPSYVAILRQGMAAGSVTEATAELTLTTPSRRACMGAEIECKVWPAAILLARWLWCHAWLLEGRCVLELGAGVGTAGLAAALSGAPRVILTDINSTALGLAKKNACINGAAVQQASRIAHLDWADPPTLSRSALGTTETWPAETNDETTQNKASSQSCSPDEIALLEGKVDLLIAADIINCEGLSDLVYRMIRLYLAPRGLFLMICPLPFHRHTVDVIRATLLDSPDFETHIVPVPSWLCNGIEEAHDIKHELYVVQWRNPDRVAS